MGRRMYIQRNIPFSFRAILASQVSFFLMVRAVAGGCTAVADRMQVSVRVQDDGSRRLTISQRFLLSLPWQVVSGRGLVGEGGKENVVKLQITVSAVTRFDRRSSAHAGGIPYLYFCRTTREFCIWLEPQVAEGIADRVSGTEMWTPRDRNVSKTICPYPSGRIEKKVVRLAQTISQYRPPATIVGICGSEQLTSEYRRCVQTRTVLY